MEMTEAVMQIPHELIIQVFGDFDVNIKQIEKMLAVTIINRGGEIKIVGDDINVKNAKKSH